MRPGQAVVLAAALAFTAGWPLFTFLGLLEPIMGDCFPDSGERCPTDAERWADAMTVLLGSLGIYAVVIGGLAFAYWLLSPERENGSE